ncbi:unnamed protein product [Tuber aestivum]|uniref:Uncharacterized protein n=1 Tax=Tuber aestivum TaxID=59557 RepID=A0A292PVU4_9PEZI|nr:unnamed protein product [Tuber aestivum]
MNEDIRAFIRSGGYSHLDDPVLDKASAKLSLLEPINDGRSYQLRIATRWNGFCIFQRSQQVSKLSFYCLYRNLSRQRPLRTSAGWIFEGYAHDWFRHGGNFVATEMGPGEDPETVTDLRFTINKSKSMLTNYFKDSTDLDNQVRASSGRGIEPSVIGKYFLPCGRNFESVDGLMFSGSDTLIVFQITIAATHDIKKHGIRTLLQMLPAAIKNLHIVFVIPRERIRNYAKAQKVPKAAELRELRESGAGRLIIRQFRLVFCEAAMRALVLGDCDTGESEMDLESGWDIPDSGMSVQGGQDMGGLGTGVEGGRDIGGPVMGAEGQCVDADLDMRMMEIA